MKDRSDNQELFTRYLLGELPEVDTVLLEERFFTDDSCYEQLLAVENELLYEYAQGELSASRREQFEKRFLSTAAERQRLETAEAVIGKLSDLAQHAGERGPQPRSLGAGWHALVASSSLPVPLMRWALAAMALMAVALGSWLLFERAALKSQIDQLRRERAAQDRDRERQQSDQLTRQNQLAEEVERERNRRLELEQELASQKSPHPKGADSSFQSIRGLLSMVLAPGIARDTGSQKRLTLGPDAGPLLITLLVPLESGYETYRAVIETDEGVELWSRTGLRANSNAGGRRVVLKLSSGLFKSGDYIITLHGIGADGKTEEVGDYYLRVVRQ